MQAFPASITSVVKHLFTVIVCASTITGAAAFNSAAATVKEITLATESQALAFCRSGAMGNFDIDYIDGGKGVVQFGPGYSCAQKLADSTVTPTISAAIRFYRATGAMAECKLASAMRAVTLCNSGGIGDFDIAYILGGRYRTIGGQGYSCGIVVHRKSTISAAICKVG